MWCPVCYISATDTTEILLSGMSLPQRCMLKSSLSDSLLRIQPVNTVISGNIVIFRRFMPFLLTHLSRQRLSHRLSISSVCTRGTVVSTRAIFLPMHLFHTREARGIFHSNTRCPGSLFPQSEVLWHQLHFYLTALYAQVKASPKHTIFFLLTTGPRNYKLQITHLSWNEACVGVLVI